MNVIRNAASSRINSRLTRQLDMAFCTSTSSLGFAVFRATYAPVCGVVVGVSIANGEVQSMHLTRGDADWEVCAERRAELQAEVGRVVGS